MTRVISAHIAIATFLAFVAGGAIPLAPYFLPIVIDTSRQNAILKVHTSHRNGTPRVFSQRAENYFALQSAARTRERC